MVYVKKRSQSYSCCILEQIHLEDKQFLHKGIEDWGLGIGERGERGGGGEGEMGRWGDGEMGRWGEITNS